jgi:hypothetical protein
MNIHRSVYPVTDPLAGLTPSQRAQLTLLCWVAGVDGDLEAQVQEAEWDARQVLKETPALIDRLNQLLFGWGAWPSIEALEASGTSWL